MMHVKIPGVSGPPVLIPVFVLAAGVLLGSLVEPLAAQERSSRSVPRLPGVVQDLSQDVRGGDQETERPPIFPAQDEGTRSITGTLDDGSELTQPLMAIRLNVIDQAASKPLDRSYELQEMNYISNYPGSFQHRVAMWCAPNIRYQPLFFEDVGLERYGYHYGNFFQPAASALHFGNSFALLPNNLRLRHPGSCEYPLGFCRPGSLAPQTRTRWLRLR